LLVNPEGDNPDQELGTPPSEANQGLDQQSGDLAVNPLKRALAPEALTEPDPKRPKLNPLAATVNETSVSTKEAEGVLAPSSWPESEVGTKQVAAKDPAGMTHREGSEDSDEESSDSEEDSEPEGSPVRPMAQLTGALSATEKSIEAGDGERASSVTEPGK
jgi:hypothetical protein